MILSSHRDPLLLFAECGGFYRHFGRRGIMSKSRTNLCPGFWQTFPGRFLFLAWRRAWARLNDPDRLNMPLVDENLFQLPNPAQLFF